jgi:predicted enzyme related to lactoylglutathione lyase
VSLHYIRVAVTFECERNEHGKHFWHRFGTDILIQAQDPTHAASFYVEQLGFTITDEAPNMISLHGGHINLFIERGPALGPVLEVTVDSVEEAKRRLVKNGCEIVKDEPDFPRCYVKDPFGLIYNLTR